MKTDTLEKRFSLKVDSSKCRKVSFVWKEDELQRLCIYLSLWGVSRMALFLRVFNPFVSNAPLLYHLKTSENCKVFWCFQGVEKGCTGNERVNKLIFSNWLWNVLTCKYIWILFLMVHIFLISNHIFRIRP